MLPVLIGLVLLPVAHAPTAQAAGPVGFGLPTAVAIGGGTPVVADVDGDGVTDVLTTDGDQIAVSLGNGAGFDPVETYPAATHTANGMQVADFTSDGLLDVVVSGYLGSDLTRGRVSILPGDGTGGFGPARVFAAPGEIRDLAVGDFDGDGVPDVVFVSLRPENVLLMFGDGTGGFGPDRTVTPTVEDGAVNVIAADLNGDGRDDLVHPGLVEGTLTVYLRGDDPNVFGPRTDYPVGFAEAAAVADLNADGVLDIATTTLTDLVVLLGSGDGSFSVQTTPESDYAGGDIVAADVDGDGDQDLVTWEYQGILVRLNTGNAVFEAPRSFSGPERAFSTVAVDLNRDHRVDLLTAQSGIDVQLNVTGLATTLTADTDPVVTERDAGTRSVQITLTRSGRIDAAATVAFRTIDGSAVAPGDYVARRGTVRFSPGQRTQVVSLSVVGDTVAEPQETFVLELIGGAGLTVVDGRAYITITDDD